MARLMTRNQSPLPSLFAARSMARAAKALILGAGLGLGGCLTGNPEPEPEPVSQNLLRRCIGEPGYDQGAMDSLLKAFSVNPPHCIAPTGGAPEKAEGVLPKTLEDPAAATLRTLVMDSRCSLVAEFQDRMEVLEDNPGLPPIMHTLDGQGNPLPTGEYYINTEFAWPDGRRDTTYTKVGIIYDPCG